MSLVKSKQRVADHGEVFTPEWMVEAMLDLVKGETERIDSRFLESAYTHSFLFFHIGSHKAAMSLQSYFTTRFFRFLVSQRKITQHALHSTYVWVPMQKWNRIWTDKDLFAKYGIAQEEQAYIKSQVKVMNIDNATADE